jgi:hypothetical protein
LAPHLLEVALREPAAEAPREILRQPFEQASAISFRPASKAPGIVCVVRTLEASVFLRDRDLVELHSEAPTAAVPANLPDQPGDAFLKCGA